jgi:hypothetical protein
MFSALYISPNGSKRVADLPWVSHHTCGLGCFWGAVFMESKGLNLQALLIFQNKFNKYIIFAKNATWYNSTYYIILKKTFVSLVVVKFIYSWGMLIGLMLRHVQQNYWTLREALCCLSLAHGPFESIWHSVSRFFKGARNLCAPSAAHISTICDTNSEMHGQSYLDMQKNKSARTEGAGAWSSGWHS